MSATFLTSLDQVQETLLVDSKIYQKRIKHYGIFESVQELKKFINQQQRSLLMRTKDEVDIEQVIIDIIQSERYQKENSNFTGSQLRTLQFVLRNDWPLKLFILTLDESQKKTLLELIFVALYSDPSNTEALQCLQLFSVNIWYFHLYDTYDTRDFVDIFKCDPSQTFYRQLLHKLNTELYPANIFSEMPPIVEGEALEGLTLESLMLCKQLKIIGVAGGSGVRGQSLQISERFVGSIKDAQAYRIYRAYVELNTAEVSSSFTN